MEDTNINNTLWIDYFVGEPLHNIITSLVGDIHMNNISQDSSYNGSNTPVDYSGFTVESGFEIYKVLTCIVICIGLPLTLMAIYALYSMVRNDLVTPIYIINLLITDLFQFCYMIVEVAECKDGNIFHIFTYIYLSCLLASVGFMVCVAMERYLLISWPMWYRFRRTIKSSVVVCVLVWALPLAYFLVLYLWNNVRALIIILAIFCLLPLPLLIFFLGGTLKALSASISVPSEEKRRILGILALVLLIYTLLFLPSILLLLTKAATDNNIQDHDILRLVSDVFLKLSPLADLVLYVFMRKGTIDKLLASVCCCRMDKNDISTIAV